jgi:CHASE1-domain containing sensor protein
MLCSLIAMVLCADASERKRAGNDTVSYSAAQWATLLVGVGLTVAVWHLLAASTERRAQEQFDAECADIAKRINRRMTLYESGLRRAGAVQGSRNRRATSGATSSPAWTCTTTSLA